MIEPTDLGIPGLTNIERIGAGGNAVVYRARQGELDRNVVVKVLLAIDADVTRRRFDRERRAMGRLSQAPGIAPLYGSGFTPSGQPYLLMPFYERGSLQEWIETHGPLSADQVKSIGVTICRAVQTAHENGVLHRDLKPANILMTRTGQPHVADFGIAHIVDDTGGTSQALTLTPLYTAPEVFDGIDSGVRSDVYSLGALLYALLNGRPAFTDASGVAPVLSLMRRINEEALPPLPSSVPRALANVVTTAMTKDPNDRYRSAGDMADALAEADTIAASGPTNRRGRMIAAAVVVAALLAGLGVLAATMLGGDGDDQEQAIAPVATPTAAAVPTPTVGESPTPPATLDAVVVPVSDAVAQAAADQVLVRIEAFSCTGAQVSSGVVINDDLVLTEERVLSSPWYVSVITDTGDYRANPLTSDRNRRLATVLVQESDAVPGPTIGAPVPGEAVVIVGAIGDPVYTTLTAVGDQLAAVPDDAALVEAGNAVIDGNGDLIGITGASEFTIDVLTLAQIEDGWNRIPPSYDCPSLSRELSPDDFAQAESPAIAELLSMQRLSNAYATENWQLVRELEPAKAEMADDQFIAGWRPLRQGFVYPIERVETPAGPTSWRIALIGHETWDGTDLTTLFCLTWTINASGAIVQTNEDTVAVFGSRPDQPQRTGFVDPAELRSVVEQNCVAPG